MANHPVAQPGSFFCPEIFRVSPISKPSLFTPACSTSSPTFWPEDKIVSIVFMPRWAVGFLSHILPCFTSAGIYLLCCSLKMVGIYTGWITAKMIQNCNARNIAFPKTIGKAMSADCLATRFFKETVATVVFGANPEPTILSDNNLFEKAFNCWFLVNGIKATCPYFRVMPTLLNSLRLPHAALKTPSHASIITRVTA